MWRMVWYQEVASYDFPAVFSCGVRSAVKQELGRLEVCDLVPRDSGITLAIDDTAHGRVARGWITR